ncbi:MULTISPECIES: sirohydrochlorin chelatase [Paraburkholderia]|uniref:Sirohydrochlorin cobaltochelatase n=1 Tax=Paraburkholderia tuberum TaxID=157910 RepID=A0A1H1F8F4_9BURK|nr:MULTISPECIES: CbiX/SirB N-terminal domain-containing protein [Paraburkholderia]MBB5408157.1 sirohydrochlorin cobaltochelatase [Paraburkholderia sp. HC6.4b]MBB5453148.1 sirohydrochlorin cobaltochelatase [Paraburkholderia sp. Kb1A]MBB5456440.1 sirohydrochlorin cobaltochelatase [Paraburkholderia sp. Cpub6]MBB5497210.1 sirohydrochlorin cobaltochelatase [Paraburkholderia sp. MM5384-R2]MDH6148809.1 sirohydrochlorin cobaltochelatase [Paraburkholderia sp. WSM4179]
MAMHGLILFGHGARDARWREPFERLADKLRAARAATGEAPAVTLAFLELMEPDLPTAVAQLVTQGCDAITVVPVFFGQGGHVRKDLPAIVDHCRAAHPGVEIRCAVAVGEDDSVLDALAQYCLRQL